ncbi:hypothetical protein ASG36_03585 [Geodermatophilus sp. Leaf369]|uniref:GNAT family N-acetyltransferase n=1 Tax=Geodermatophilus sp. Leaf369 TaxID=1736354 RepID=UPI0006F283C3|nr:GNAT family N-acetyltransferase [Geodermatophilus sp. Leaf369]KQS60087.1 hypothetical protein ASG36_03585 [Geodermatophilus sp. Leaf369]
MTPDPTWVWPARAPASGGVRLRAFTDADVAAVQALARDPYVPQIGSLVLDACAEEAAAWITAQHGRLAERAGFSFAVADATTDACLGACGLWLRDVGTGTATAGYAVVPEHRGRGVATDALRAVTAFAWTRPPVQRVELHVEPWNAASRRVALAAGYAEGALLPGAHEIGGRFRDVVAFTATRPG